MIKKITRQTTTHAEFLLTGEDIVKMLRGDLRLPIRAGETCTVQVTVPGGADWSGMTLDIDESLPIIVTIKVSSGDA